ncbi:MAG: c-type cytochrome [Mariprofundaceae bacterium]|nr:c-type cytochrome [Mariprofundaceae bacterium]
MMRISLLALVFTLFAMPLYVQAADAELGEQIFNKRCAMCHNTVTAQRKIGPAMTGVFERESESGIGILTEARLHEWLENPKSLKPNTRMPKYGPMQDAANRQAVIDYLKTL